ncbi:hypothetical protein BB560_003943 [Smittium megazygosporum]|uniref:Alpha-1,3/1,6-mannosyltransferase ALG2 n=1 Tax=Smittium megazygosporum TaxID=133381 RepID=A0A2T9ZAL7_9FUNG|nr:hypothetical protein BB560_003943 [Smittium megazygosporum]
MTEELERRKLNIAFVHPNLGIGGAERLMVDSALGLQKLGHKVIIYTMYHDRNHCFKETIDGTLEVRVRGNTLFPKSINNSFHIFCTTLQSLHLSFTLMREDPNAKIDIVIVDQIASPIPLLKISHMKVLFYCHFPDKLQARHDTFFRRVYRFFFDTVEELTISEADNVLVNSRFTQTVFYDSFKFIAKVPEVLYPGVNFESLDTPIDEEDESLEALLESIKSYKKDRGNLNTLLSINRFERKKNIQLAIKSYSEALWQETRFAKKKSMSSSYLPGTILIVAGGYDKAVQENLDCFSELKSLALELDLQYQIIWPRVTSKNIQIETSGDIVQNKGLVIFLPSFNDNMKKFLLGHADCVLYTPDNEHFGLVPIEAMYMSTPVVAVNSGGPTETILDGKTGFLSSPTPIDFANNITKILGISSGQNDSPNFKETLGKQAKEHVLSRFSLDVYTQKLEEYIYETMGYKGTLPVLPVFIAIFVGIVVITLALLSIYFGIV